MNDVKKRIRMMGSIAMSAPGVNVTLDLHAKPKEHAEGRTIVFRGQEIPLDMGAASMRDLVVMVTELALEHDGIMVEQLHRWRRAGADVLADACVAAYDIGMLELSNTDPDYGSDWMADLEAILVINRPMFDATAELVDGQ